MIPWSDKIYSTSRILRTLQVARDAGHMTAAQTTDGDGKPPERGDPLKLPRCHWGMVGVHAEPDYQSAYRKLGGHHNLALFDIMQRRCSDILDLEVME